MKKKMNQKTCIFVATTAVALAGFAGKLSEADAIDGYILPCYDTLHTLGSKYLVEDITEMMAERGVKI